MAYTRHMALGIAAWIAIALSTLTASAQDQPQPVQVREALRLAIELYKNRDYDKAAPYFDYAQKSRDALSPPEQADLASFSGHNAAGLKGQREGAAQMKQAEEALKAGKTQEAGKLLSTLNSNQHLSADDRQKLAELTNRVQKQPPAADLKSKTDGKTMLVSGRAALASGDFDAAEAWAAQAEKASSGMSALLQPWGDSPAKLRRDIQTARSKQPQPQQNDLAKKDGDKKDDASWMPRFITGFKGDAKSPEPKKDGPAPKQESNSTIAGLFGIGAQSKEPAKKDAPLNESKGDAAFARRVVADGFIMLKAGDIEKARFLAMKAKELNVAWGPNEQTPDLLLHEIQRTVGGTPPEAPKTDPIAKKDFPEPAARKIDPDKKIDPRAALRQGRALLQQRKFDEADKACTQALAAHARWGLWEDNPEKLRRDIVSARKVHDRDESVKLMVEARAGFAKGNIDEAEAKALKAKHLHGPFGVFDFGDRPDKLLEEIHRAKLARGDKDKASPFEPKGEPKKDTPLAKDKILPPVGVVAPPAGVQLANKNRAIVMLREARELERQGLLMEARQKTFEARSLKAPFQPDEESPEHVLTSLTASCDRRINAHLQQAVDQLGNMNDPQRVDKSQAHLISARQLAVAFELDASRVDQTAQHLQAVLSGARPLNEVAPIKTQDPFGFVSKTDPPSSGDPKVDALHKLGREKLTYAQRELTAGKYAQARKMAEELYNPVYGVQDDAMRFLRSISAEETNQQILQALRNFDVGVTALADKDYRKAMAIFQTIDPLLLPETQQARMRDIMGMREMQPQQLVAAVNDRGEKIRGSKIEPKKPFDEPARGEDLIGNVKAAETVQFQALRQRGFDALKKAHEQWKSGQQEDAMKTLRAYGEAVNLAGFDANKSTELRRAIDARLQQYTALKAEATLLKEERKMQFTSYHDESKYQSNIKKKQDEIVTMMKEAHELYKQEKLKEATAIARKVLEIDSENPAALAMLAISETRKKQKNWDNDEHDNWKNFQEWLPHKVGADGVNDDTPVGFNAKFAGKRKPGDGSFYTHELKDPKERAIQYRLRQPISLNFKDVPLKQAIEDIAIASGVQVVPDDQYLEKARINMDSPLSIKVENIDMKSALNILLSKLQLTYIIEDQVLKITTPDRTSGRLVRVTYPVADLVVAVEDHPLPDVLNLQKALERSMLPSGYPGYNGMVASPFAQSYGAPISSHLPSDGLGRAFGAQSGGPGSPGGPPKEKTKEEMARILVDLIKNTIAKDKWEDVGGTGTIQYFPMGLALVINQPQEVQEDIQLLLATLRKLQDLQVSVELRAVLVSETFFERIGVDFDMNIRTPTNRAEPSLVSGAFVPAPFVNRFGSGLSGLVSGLTPAGTLTPDLNIPIRNSTFNFTTPQFGGYQPEAGLSLGLAFLSDIQVFMFLEAVQGDRRAHIMQAPKISVYNGQQAFISGSMTRPVVQGVSPVPLPNGNMIMLPQTVPMPFGLGMQVQPVVSPDRRFIRLNVTPQIGAGTIDPAGAFVIAQPQPVFAQFDPPLIGPVQPPLPTGPLSVTVTPTQANLTILNTTVNVPDGGTVLLGGFKFLAEERTEYGPPILSKIPYLSRLFRNVGWSRDGSTLIYLITARVIMIEEEEGLFLGTIPPIPGR